MWSGRKTNLILIFVFLFVIIVFAYSYNASITTVVTNTIDDERAQLQQYNDEILSKIKETESSDEWLGVIRQYDGISIKINDNSNNIIASNSTREGTALDIKAQSPFEFKGKAYLLTSSIFVLTDYVTSRKAILNFVIVELLIALSIIFLLVFIIYTIMLRPYRTFYRSLEKYEKTGEISKKKFKGYIGKVYDRFYLLTQNLERQQKNQQSIIASISHDIKTPLTSIMGYTEQLKKDNISEERKQRYLDKVYNKSLEIRGLVDEFDEYLSYEMLKSLKTEKISTFQLCFDLSDEYFDELENLGVAFEINNYAPKKNIMLDLTRMQRVFGNIISNSLKHFNGGEKKIRIDVNSKKNHVIISISDNGAGVQDDKLELIFEPLYTSDKGRKVAGLGLAICREIVESHGGSIYAKQSDMGGLEICIELEACD